MRIYIASACVVWKTIPVRWRSARDWCQLTCVFSQMTGVRCTCGHWCQLQVWTLVSGAHVDTGVRCTCGHWCQVHMWTLVSGACVDTGVRCTCGHRCQVHVWTQMSCARVDTGVRCMCEHWCQVHVRTFDESWDDVIIMHCIAAT